MTAQAAFNQAMRRKLRAVGASVASQGAEKVWPLALARAARDRLTLGLEVTALTMSRLSLTELLEIAPERAMIGVLEGPKDGLGMIALSASLLAGLIEVQTMGRVSQAAALIRRPTRTDAAMVADWIDDALFGLEAGLAADADLPWADGFRYASFLDDARPLGLLLDDVPYRTITVEISLASGAKSGVMYLALPAEGRGRKPQGETLAVTEAEARLAFTRHLATEAMAAECTLDAVIARLTLPLSAVLTLAPGMILPVAAGLDRIAVQTTTGRPLATGKLGQHRGQRAVRLTALVDANDVAPHAAPAQAIVPEPATADLRAAG